jgi:hypothetical protein
MNKFLNTINSIKFKWGSYPQKSKRWVVLGSTVITLGLVVGMIYYINTTSTFQLPETGGNYCKKDPDNTCEPRPDCKCGGRVCGECTEEEPDDPVVPTAVPTAIPRPTSTPIPTAVPGTLGAVDAPVNNATIAGDYTVSGWFLDLQGVNTVQIVVDGSYVASATKGISRPDVLAAYPSFSNANAGFSYVLNTKNYTNGTHTITVNMIDNGTPFVQMSISRVVNILNLTPTATPVVLPGPRLSVICNNNVRNINIGWSPMRYTIGGGGGGGMTPSKVEISTNQSFSQYWYLTITSDRTSSVTAPTDGVYGRFAQSDAVAFMPDLSAGATYYVRLFDTIWNKYTAVTSITMPAGSDFICPTITPTPVVVNTPTNLVPSGNINPGVQNITWTPNGTYSSFGLRINDITDGWDSSCANPIGNDVCKNVTTNSYSYNFLAGHKYAIWVHNISGIISSSPANSDVTVNNVAIVAPIVDVVCAGTTLSLDIKWNAQNLNPEAYWVDISTSSSFVNNFWHKKAVMPVGASSYRATAPVDIDGGYFVEYQFPEPIMPSIRRNKTYYVKIWYHTPIYRSSFTTTVTTPSLCGGV